MSYSAEVSEGGGDFPEIEDGVYTAIIQDVSEEWEEVNRFKKTDKDPDYVTRQYLTWELTDDEAPEGVTLRQYFTIPEGLKKGFLNKKSNIFATMEVLFGTDYMNGKFQVDLPSWQGMEARLTIKAPREKGVQTGWPKIVDVMEKKKPRRERELATAGAKKGKGDDDDF